MLCPVKTLVYTPKKALSVGQETVVDPKVVNLSGDYDWQSELDPGPTPSPLPSSDPPRVSESGYFLTEGIVYGQCLSSKGPMVVEDRVDRCLVQGCWRRV